LWGNIRLGEQLQDLGTDGSTRLTKIIKKWEGGMDWIDLAQDRDRWCAVVSAVMKLQVV
jgi:hypothetical protein